MTSGASCVFCGQAIIPGKPASISRAVVSKALMLAAALVVLGSCFLLLNR
jgi:hypothetical protein